MARKTIFVSDLSGKEIDNNRDAVTITVKYSDARKGVIVVDAHPDDSEVKRLVQAGRQQVGQSRRTAESRSVRFITGRCDGWLPSLGDLNLQQPDGRDGQAEGDSKRFSSSRMSAMPCLRSSRSRSVAS